MGKITFISLVFFFRWKTTFLMALIFGLPVMIIKFTYLGLMRQNIHDITVIPGLSLQNLLLLILCTVVQVIVILNEKMICVCACVHVCVHVCMCMCINACACVYGCVYVCMFVHVCICVCVCIYVY